MLSKTVPRAYGIRPFMHMRRAQAVHVFARSHATANGNAKSPLEQQRLRRPVSPHLTIYKWEYQSLASILQRFSGIALSGSLYTFATAYLLLPSTMVDVDVLGSIVSAVATLPESLKIGGKFLLGWPFAYHAVNGVKQLAWDRVIGMRDKKMIRMVARGVAGVSFLGALGLALL